MENLVIDCLHMQVFSGSGNLRTWGFTSNGMTGFDLYDSICMSHNQL